MRERLKADGVVLIVLAGGGRMGFSAQLSLPMIRALPKILREMANEIESNGGAL